MIKDESGIALGSAVLPDLKSLEPKKYDFKSLNKSRKIIDKSDHQMVIPIQTIAAKYLPKIDQFIKTFKNCLDAYLSRFNQLFKITRLVMGRVAKSRVRVRFNFFFGFGSDFEIFFGLRLGQSKKSWVWFGFVTKRVKRNFPTKRLKKWHWCFIL